jgi:outer membrane PBP1 activator LpoA protein
MGFTTKLLSVSLLAVVLTGCTSSSIVNLTPRQQPRNDTGLYLVEAEWQSNQRSIRYDTLSPKVIVGTNAYVMRQTQLLTNRWEALIPVAKDEKLLNYHYKFDFKYTTVPTKLNDSKISVPYQLKITE